MSLKEAKDRRTREGSFRGNFESLPGLIPRRLRPSLGWMSEYIPQEPERDGIAIPLGISCQVSTIMLTGSEGSMPGDSERYQVKFFPGQECHRAEFPINGNLGR